MRFVTAATACALAASGCFAPELPEGAIACGEAGCPAAMVCAPDGLCYSDSAELPPDPAAQSRQVALAVGNYDEPSRVYAYCDGALLPAWTADQPQPTTSLAWGDITNSGDLELVLGNFGAASRAYNVEDRVVELWAAPRSDRTRSVALGDYDGDGDTDLALGNQGESLRVYKWWRDRDTFIERWESDAQHATRAVQWAADDSGNGNGNGNGNGDDWNLAVGAWGDANVVYHTDDDGWLFPNWESQERDDTTTVAWGDVNGDGEPDLIVGNWEQPNRLYLKQGWGDYALAWSAPETGDPTTSLAFADYDADGDLDLAVGNENAPNRIYRNDGGSLVPVWVSPEADATTSLSWGDVDSDGDLDLAVGNSGQPNRVYRNDTGAFELAWSAASASATTSIAWASWELGGETGLCSAGSDRQ